MATIIYFLPSSFIDEMAWNEWEVASHGGHVDLVGVDNGKAIIAFGGGCQGCGMADVTLKQGVEVMITDNVPEIIEVIDATDHAAGVNPFY